MVVFTRELNVLSMPDGHDDECRVAGDRSLGSSLGDVRRLRVTYEHYPPVERSTKLQSALWPVIHSLILPQPVETSERLRAAMRSLARCSFVSDIW